MTDLPMLDLSIIENESDPWAIVYGGWIEDARIRFNSPNHQLLYEDNDQRNVFVLPPVPINGSATFRNVRIQTRTRAISVRFNNHNLYVVAFEVEGRWYVFKDAEVGDVQPCTRINVRKTYPQVLSKVRNNNRLGGRTRENIPLGTQAITAVVNAIANSWDVHDDGIAYISSKQTQSAVVLFQMLSKTIRFETVRETLLGLVDNYMSDTGESSVEWSPNSGSSRRN